MKKYRWSRIPVLALSLALAGAPFALAAAAPVAEMSVGAATVDWHAAGSYERLVLTVSGPDGQVHRQSLDAKTAPSFSLFDAAGNRRPDGNYTWELRAAPQISAEIRQQLAAARAAGRGDAAAAELRQAGKLPAERVQSGSFAVLDGSFVGPGLKEESTPRAKPQRQMTNITAADQVIPDDLIVQGSACVGLDCVNNESFGFDTIRLKENSTRIKFEDTSVGTFPSNDWQLTANDSASGGANKFSIEDITGSKVPFTITAGAATNSIFVDSTGRLGLRTATPVLDIHVNTSNTPAIRLEQNNSGGFTAQTWDVAGNEANFFVRDVTGGSRLPFRIRPGAPTSSIDISADGNVGVGTASPSAKLHVSTATGAIQEEILATNNNEARISIQNSNLNVKYITGVNNTTPGLWFLSRDGGGGTIVEVNQRLDGGSVASMKVNGSLQATNVVFTSSRDFKDSFKTIDPQDVLSKVAALPIQEWKFKEGPQDIRHIGPMAEDFHNAFGLNPDNKSISVTDTSGVALAAIQGLLQQVQQLQKQNAELAGRLQAMETLLQKQN